VLQSSFGAIYSRYKGSQYIIGMYTRQYSIGKNLSTRIHFCAANSPHFVHEVRRNRDLFGSESVRIFPVCLWYDLNVFCASGLISCLLLSSELILSYIWRSSFDFSFELLQNNILVLLLCSRVLGFLQLSPWPFCN